MTTFLLLPAFAGTNVVEAYRLDRYDNANELIALHAVIVVEAYRLDRYDNLQ